MVGVIHFPVKRGQVMTPTAILYQSGNSMVGVIYLSRNTGYAVTPTRNPLSIGEFDATSLAKV